MRKYAWLLTAAFLLAMAAFLMSRSDSAARTDKQKPRVEFPRYAKREDHDRNQKRRTLPPAPRNPNQDSDVEIQRKRDPMLTALPPSKGKSVVVFEASVLRDSPLGQHWLNCMMSAYELNRLNRFKDEFGFDPIQNTDRIAFSSEKVLLVGGDFGDANWEAFGQDKRVVGNKGVIIETERGGPGYVGIWNDELLVLSDNEKEIEAAFDRIEDRAPPAPPRINDYAQYGDIYGVLSADDLAMMLPEDERELAEKLRGAVSDVELHVDASEDVAMTAEVTGPVAQDVEDLSKSLGAALSLARLQAQTKREKDLADLLDFASISPRDGRFSIDLALPLDVIIQKMGPCKRRDAGEGEGGAAPMKDEGKEP